MTADISELIAELNSDELAERAAAAEQLSQMGEDARAAAVPLVRAAGDEDEEVREYAVAALEELGAPSAEDVDALATLLCERKADVAYWAATLLGRLEEAAAPAVDALTRALDESTELAVRQRAAQALGKIGSNAAPATDALKKAVSSNDPRLARLATRALENIGN